MSAVAQLGWSPEHACLFHLFFGQRFSNSRPTKGPTKTRHCRSGGVDAQLTPLALERALLTILDPSSNHKDIMLTVLNLMDIARCARHCKQVISLEQSDRLLVEAAVVRVREVTSICEPLAETESGMNRYRGLDLALAQRSFSQASYEAIEAGAEGEAALHRPSPSRQDLTIHRITKKGQLLSIGAPVVEALSRQNVDVTLPTSSQVAEREPSRTTALSTRHAVNSSAEKGTMRAATQSLPHSSVAGPYDYVELSWAFDADAYFQDHEAELGRDI